MNSSNLRDPDFCLHFSVRKKPIILLGLGLFLPHGENICGDLQLTGTVKNEIDDKYITADSFVSTTMPILIFYRLIKK